MRALTWAARRLLAALLTLLVASVLVFAAARLLPGSYTDLVLGPFASGADRAAARADFGLDRPVAVQYLSWLGQVLQGNLGVSAASRAPISHEFVARVPVSATLAFGALLLALLVGVPLGVWSAVRRSEAGSGSVGRLVGGLGISLPEFVVGTVVVYLFSRYRLGLPASGFTDFGESVGGALRSLVLPVLVLALFCTAATVRTTRDAVLGVLVEPYVGAAVARGLSPLSIVRHHVLRNASVPVLTLVATLTAYLLGGTVIVETIFDVPGLGSYLVTALDRRDYAVIEAGVLFATAVFILASFAVEAATGLLDPRLAAAAGTGSER